MNVENSDADGRVDRQGCSQCGFINVAWSNGGVSRNSSTPKTGIYSETQPHFLSCNLSSSFEGVGGQANISRNEISPIKCVDATDGRSLLRSFSTPNSGIYAQSKPNFLSFNLSQQSSQNCSFEGVGGNASTLDPLEMQHKIAELQFQLRRLTEEKSELQEQLMTIEDEKAALQSQKEDSDKKECVNKANIEKLRELSLELEETNNALASLEDKNKHLSLNVIQLKKDNHEMVLHREAAIRDYGFTCSQLESCRKQLQTKKSEFAILEDELREEIRHLYAKKIEYEVQLCDLNSKLNHLEATNDHLRRETQELLKQSQGVKADSNEYTILKETFGVEDDSTCSNEEAPNAISFTNSCSICTINKNSLYTEISAALMKRDSSSDKANLRKLLDIFIVLQQLRQLVISESSNNPEPIFIEETLPAVEKAVSEPEVLETNNEILKAQLTQNDIDTAREEVVRRINEELAEFREQLKMSQELFHALSNSAQNVNVTQSCPLLAETENPKFVDCSTQTAVINENQHSSFYLTNNCHDVDNDMDGQDEDKLSDDIRLTINLPTVLEESEQETETSPATAPKVMSSKKGSRRLVRGIATEEDKADDEIKSDNEYASAVSSPPGSKSASVYNSLERPLHVSGSQGLLSSSPIRRDFETASINSGGSTTTFGSPLSSPSSPTYWTPSQGSSSQETITNHDGDKTPVNEVYGHIAADTDSFPKSSSSNGIGPHTSSWISPIDNTLDDFPIGVIPAEQRDAMIKYAYDPTRRSEKPAKILTRDQWRTLRSDLNTQTHEKFMKDYAQEEGHDGDGGLNYCDLDEEAEEYCEKFPSLVEDLFSSLDLIKDKETDASKTQLDDISKRFRTLVNMFKTEHTNMNHRFELKKTEHENSRRRMKDICDHLKQSVQVKSEVLTKSQKPPDESTEILLSLKDTSQELEMHFITLSRTARRLGMLDVEKRMYKMIEVMVLYVHILKNLLDNLNKEYTINRNPLEEHNINVKSEKSFGQLNNNNNGTVRSIDNGDLSETSDRCEDGKPKKILEGLLGRPEKQILRKRLVLGEKRSSNNVVVRHVAEWYEVLRRELYWPWSWDQTWKGIKQGFSIILMLIGLFIILRSLFPAVSANECAPVFDLASVFSKYGSLSHNHRPPI